MAATRQTIKWVKNVYGGGAHYQAYPEGDSETYKKGALVIYDLSEDGIVEVTRSSGAVSAATMLGVAVEDATGTSDTTQDILIPRPGDIFEASLASSQTAVVAPDLDNTGQTYGIVKLNSTGGEGVEYVVNEGETSTVLVKVIAVHPVDVERRGFPATALTAGDRVLFQFLASVIDSDGNQA